MRRHIAVLALVLVANSIVTPVFGGEMRAFRVEFDWSADFPAHEAEAITEVCKSVFPQVAGASLLNWWTDVQEGVQLPFASQPHLLQSQGLHAGWWWTLPPSERTFRIAWINGGVGAGGYAQPGIVEAGRADATLPLTAVVDASVVLNEPQHAAFWRTVLCGKAFHEFDHLWGVCHEDGLDGNGNPCLPSYRKAYHDPVTGFSSVTANVGNRLLELSGAGFGAPEADATRWMNEQEEHYAQLLESHGVVVGSVTVPPPGPCIEDENTLCLLGERFRVRVMFTPPQTGVTQPANAIPFTDRAGMFWFFNEANVEMLVKMQDACVPQFDRFWVFFAATTNVGFTVTVDDTVALERRVYTNPQGMVALPVADTEAFATCP